MALIQDISFQVRRGSRRERVFRKEERVGKKSNKQRFWEATEDVCFMV